MVWRYCLYLMSNIITEKKKFHQPYLNSSISVICLYHTSNEDFPDSFITIFFKLLFFRFLSLESPSFLKMYLSHISNTLIWWYRFRTVQMLMYFIFGFFCGSVKLVDVKTLNEMHYMPAIHPYFVYTLLPLYLTIYILF